MSTVQERPFKAPSQRGPLSLPLLERVRIASPCSVPWTSMKGDDRTRFCDQCQLHVHNLSNMVAAEAEAFLQSAMSSGGRVCGAFYQRADGTMLTQDCPVGIATLRRRARNAGLKVAALVLTMLGTGTWLRAREVDRGGPQDWSHLQPYERVCAWLGAKRTVPAPIAGGLIMGKLPAPAPIPSPTTTEGDR